jgi:CBS domain containing-hemolysin-like protein
LFVIFLILDGLVAAVRASLVHARLPQLLSLREQNPPQVDRTLNLLEKNHLTATLRLSLMLSHVLLGVAVLFLFSGMPGTPGALGVETLLLAALAFALVVISLEFLIERMILQDVEMWALRLHSLAYVLDFILRPFTWVLMLVVGSSEVWKRPRSGMTEVELKTWVEEEQLEGGLEQGERRMIYSIFQFGDTLCREIMVPRIDVFALDVNTSVPEAIDGALKSGHSRLPVYEEAIDNIIGVLYAKDLLRLKLEHENGNSIRNLVRPAYFVPEAKKVDELLREMQARGVHMSIIVDEYGGMAGIVTLEDIVEEIVGEIRDEYDESEELVYQQISEDEYIFLGRIDLDDFNEILNTHLTKEVADTLGGYIYGQIGRMPVGGETMNVEGWEIKVEQVSGRRIRLVRALRKDIIGEKEEKLDEPER